MKVCIYNRSTVFLTGVLAFNFYLPSSVELSIVVGFPKQETKMADTAADFSSRTFPGGGASGENMTTLFLFKMIYSNSLNILKEYVKIKRHNYV